MSGAENLGGLPLYATGSVPGATSGAWADRRAEVARLRRAVAVVMNPSGHLFPAALAARLLTRFSVVGVAFFLLLAIFAAVSTVYRPTLNQAGSRGQTTTMDDDDDAGGGSDGHCSPTVPHHFHSTPPDPQVGRMRHVAVAALVLSAVDLLLAGAFEVARSFGFPVDAAAGLSSWAERVLRLFAYLPISGADAWCRVFVPGGLLIFAAWREARRISGLIKHAEVHHPLLNLDLDRRIGLEELRSATGCDMLFLPEGILGPPGPGNATPAVLNRLVYRRGGGYRVQAIFWILVAGLAWPSLLATPFAVLVLLGAGVWVRGRRSALFWPTARRGAGRGADSVAGRWSSGWTGAWTAPSRTSSATGGKRGGLTARPLGDGRLGPGSFVCLTGYTLLVGVALYVWQIDDVRDVVPETVAATLGVYTLRGAVPSQLLVPRVLQVIALCGLVVSLSALGSEARLRAKASAQRAMGSDEDAKSHVNVTRSPSGRRSVRWSHLRLEATIVEAEARMEARAVEWGRPTRFALRAIYGEADTSFVLGQTRIDALAVADQVLRPDLVAGMVSPRPSVVYRAGRMTMGEAPSHRRAGVPPMRSPLTHSHLLDGTPDRTPGDDRGGGQGARPSIAGAGSHAREPRARSRPRHPSPNGMEKDGDKTARSHRMASSRDTSDHEGSQLFSGSPRGGAAGAGREKARARQFLRMLVGLFEHGVRVIVTRSPHAYARWVANAIDAVCGRPYLTASSLCLAAVLQPSILALPQLLTGVFILATEPKIGAAFLRRHATWFYAWLAVWTLACYVSTALRGLFLLQLSDASLDLLDLLNSIGIYSFDDNPPAALAMLGMFVQVFLVAAVGHRARVEGERASDVASMPSDVVAPPAVGNVTLRPSGREPPAAVGTALPTSSHSQRDAMGGGRSWSRRTGSSAYPELGREMGRSTTMDKAGRQRSPSEGGNSVASAGSVIVHERRGSHVGDGVAAPNWTRVGSSIRISHELEIPKNSAGSSLTGGHRGVLKATTSMRVGPTWDLAAPALPLAPVSSMEEAADPVTSRHVRMSSALQNDRGPRRRFGRHFLEDTDAEAVRMWHDVLSSTQRFVRAIEGALVYLSLPLVLFAVGVSHKDALHVFYVFTVVTYLSRGIINPAPKLHPDLLCRAGRAPTRLSKKKRGQRRSFASVFHSTTFDRPVLLRAYAAVHLVLMFVLKLPTLCGIYDSPADVTHRGAPLGRLGGPNNGYYVWLPATGPFSNPAVYFEVDGTPRPFKELAQDSVTCHMYGSTPARAQAPGRSVSPRPSDPSTNVLKEALALVDEVGRVYVEGAGKREEALRLAGLWDPHVAADMGAVLVILVLAAWHSLNVRQSIEEDAKKAATAALSSPGDSHRTLRAEPLAESVVGRSTAQDCIGGVDLGDLDDAGVGAATEAADDPVAKATATAASGYVDGSLPIERRKDGADSKPGTGEGGTARVQAWLLAATGRATVGYGINVVAVAAYLMVVSFMSQGAVLGLLYLVMTSALLLLPPLVWATVAAQLGKRVDANPRHTPFQGRLRWNLVRTLAILSLVDFTAQYLLTFTLVTRNSFELDENVKNELRQTVGLDPDAKGWRLCLYLARPALIMWLISLYRAGYRAGLEDACARSLDIATLNRRELTGAELEHKHRRTFATFRRWLIRNARLIVVFFAFHDAVVNRGAIGAFLVLILCAGTLLWISVATYKGPEAGVRVRAILSSIGLPALRVYAVLSILSAWTFPLPEIQNAMSTEVADWLSWLGLPANATASVWQLAVQSDGDLNMEALMRSRAVLLAFSAFELATTRWLANMPAQMCEAAGLATGAVCALSWPPAPLRLERLERALDRAYTLNGLRSLRLTPMARLRLRLRPFVVIMQRYLQVRAGVGEAPPNLQPKGSMRKARSTEPGAVPPPSADCGAVATHSDDSSVGIFESQPKMDSAPPEQRASARPTLRETYVPASAGGKRTDRRRADPDEAALRYNLQRLFAPIALVHLAETAALRCGLQASAILLLVAATCSFSLLSFPMVILVVYMLRTPRVEPDGRSERSGGAPAATMSARAIVFYVSSINLALFVTWQFLVLVSWWPDAPLVDAYPIPDSWSSEPVPFPVGALDDRAVWQEARDGDTVMVALHRWLSISRIEVSTLYLLFASFLALVAEYGARMGRLVHLARAGGEGPERGDGAELAAVDPLLALDSVPRLIQDHVSGMARGEEGMIWSRLSSEAHKGFTVLDRARYFLVISAPELTLILIVFISSASRDVIHLVYLLMAVALFRNREKLRMVDNLAADGASATSDGTTPLDQTIDIARRNLGTRGMSSRSRLDAVNESKRLRMRASEDSAVSQSIVMPARDLDVNCDDAPSRRVRWWWRLETLGALQALNILVILITLAVQAPWEYISWDIFKGLWGEACSTHTVLGVSKVRSASEALTLGRWGSNEILIFVSLHVLSLVRKTSMFANVTRLSNDLESLRTVNLVRRKEQQKAAHSAQLEATSRWRTLRRVRVRGLRRAVMQVAYTGNPRPEALQELIALLEDQQLNDATAHMPGGMGSDRVAAEGRAAGAEIAMTPTRGRPGVSFGATKGAVLSGHSSVMNLRSRLRSVSVLAAGSNSTRVHRPVAMEKAIKRAKLAGWRGNADREFVPGWDVVLHVPAGDTGPRNSALGSATGPARDGGLNTPVGIAERLVNRSHHQRSWSGDIGVLHGGQPPGTGMRQAVGHHRRSASVAMAAGGMTPGQAGRLGGTTTADDDRRGNSTILVAPRAGTTGRLMWTSEIGEPPAPFLRFGRWLRRIIVKFFRDTETRQLVAYAAMGVLVYAVDVSVLAAVLPGSMLLYALVAEDESRTYWHLIQAYLEVLIIVDYVLMVVASAGCGGFGDAGTTLSANLQYVGLAEEPARAIPLFMAYLAVLAYTTSLRAKARGSRGLAGRPSGKLAADGAGMAWGAKAGTPKAMGDIGKQTSDGGLRGALFRDDQKSAPAARGSDSLAAVPTAAGGLAFVQGYEANIDGLRPVEREIRLALNRALGRSDRDAIPEFQFGRSLSLLFSMSTTSVRTFFAKASSTSERAPYFVRLVLALDALDGDVPTLADAWDQATRALSVAEETAARLEAEAMAREKDAAAAELEADYAEKSRLRTMKSKRHIRGTPGGLVITPFPTLHQKTAASEAFSAAELARSSTAAAKSARVAAVASRVSADAAAEVVRAKGAAVAAYRARLQLFFQTVMDTVRDAQGQGIAEAAEEKRQEEEALGRAIRFSQDGGTGRTPSKQASSPRRWQHPTKESTRANDADKREATLLQQPSKFAGASKGLIRRFIQSRRKTMVVGDKDQDDKIEDDEEDDGGDNRAAPALAPACPPALFVDELRVRATSNDGTEESEHGWSPTQQWMPSLPIESGDPALHASGPTAVQVYRVEHLVASAATENAAGTTRSDVAAVVSARERKSMPMSRRVERSVRPSPLLSVTLEMIPGLGLGASRSVGGNSEVLPRSRFPARDLVGALAIAARYSEVLIERWRAGNARAASLGLPEPYPAWLEDTLGILGGLAIEVPKAGPPGWGMGDKRSRAAPVWKFLAARLAGDDDVMAFRASAVRRAVLSSLQPMAPLVAPLPPQRTGGGGDGGGGSSCRRTEGGGWPERGAAVSKEDASVDAESHDDGNPVGDVTDAPVSLHRGSEREFQLARPPRPGTSRRERARSGFGARFAGGPILAAAQAAPSPLPRQRTPPLPAGAAGFGGFSGTSALASTSVNTPDFPGVVPGAASGSLGAEKDDSTAASPARPPPLSTTPGGDGSPSSANRADEDPTPGLDGAQIIHVEAHDRARKDFYPVTVGLDFLSFVLTAGAWGAVFPEPASGAAVPVAYLLVLLLEFFLMVVDRMCYIMGSMRGKFLLHFTQVALFLTGVTHTFWWLELKTGGRTILRIFLLVRGAALVFGALQLKSGYPEGSSYSNGIGRYSQLYLQFPNIIGWWIFAITTSIPFVFELRHLLDWASTLTTLRFVDWLLVEDIHASLFLATFDRNIRHFRYLGRKEPSWRKVLQGVLLFLCLCALVWAPLVLFASSNPVVATPTVRLDGATVALSAQLPVSSTDLAISSAATAAFLVPLFQWGGSWTSTVWEGSAEGATSEGKKLVDQYGADGVRLVCASPTSVLPWDVTPPVEAALDGILATDGSSVAVTYDIDLSRAVGGTRRRAGECRASGSTLLSPATTELIRTAITAPAPGPGDPPFRVPLEPAASAGGAEAGLWPLVWNVTGGIYEDQECVVTPAVRTDPANSRRDEIIARDGKDVVGLVDDSAEPTAQRVFCDLMLEGTIIPDPALERNSLVNPFLVDPDAAPTAVIYDPLGPRWWKMRCGFGATRASSTLSFDDPASASSSDLPGACSADPTSGDVTGPQIVVLLDDIADSDARAPLIDVASLSISGLYLGIVWAVGKFVRVAVTNMKLKIPYEQIPDPSRLRALIDDIYIARAEGDLELEEELFWTLVTIYRVPGVLFELTRKTRTHRIDR